MYGFYLTPKAIGHAELTLGGIDHSKFVGDPTYIPLIAETGRWFVTPTQIFANGRLVTTPLNDLEVFFDSGTSNVYFPANITQV